MRTIRGRVVDQQGNPLANIEVFQSGDGPEGTATKTDPDGRFALGGFRPGPVCLFARGSAGAAQRHVCEGTGRRNARAAS